MSEFFVIVGILLFSTIRLATPLIFAALGGLFSERAGVINIALEGLMLAGAFTAAVVTYETSNPYIGFVAGMAAGAFVALIFAVAVIRFEADQVDRFCDQYADAWIACSDQQPPLRRLWGYAADR